MANRAPKRFGSDFSAPWMPPPQFRLSEWKMRDLCITRCIKGKLETAPSYINEITLYLDHEDCKASLILLEKSGIVILFSRRKSKIRRCMFGLILDTPEWYVVCLHFRFANQINIPVSIWQLISFVERNEICTLPLGSCRNFFLVKWLLNFMPF